MTHETSETLTTIGAWGAVSSPVWLPVLKDVSTLAGLMLPILGALWLATQIVVKIIDTYKRHSKK